MILWPGVLNSRYPAWSFQCLFWYQDAASNATRRQRKVPGHLNRSHSFQRRKQWFLHGLPHHTNSWLVIAHVSWQASEHCRNSSFLRNHCVLTKEVLWDFEMCKVLSACNELESNLSTRIEAFKSCFWCILISSVTNIFYVLFVLLADFADLCVHKTWHRYHSHKQL